MDDYESLSHSKWECKYHVVFIPKCRRTTLYSELRQHLGEVFRRLAMQKERRGRGGPSDARSCAHDDLDPAQIRGFAGDRIYQGQKR
jgi:Transposase IS200 like